MQNIKITYGEEKPVYYVIAEGGAAPTKGHASRIKARNEATRLAKKHPGTKFSVVKLKEQMIYEPVVGAGQNFADLEKQVAARNNLHLGCAVRVKNNHHSLGGYTGTLQRFGDLDYNDSSVYVLLDGDNDLTRFAPSSLDCISGSARERESRAAYERTGNEEAQPRPDAPPIGDLARSILGGLFLAGIAAGLKDAAEEASEAPEADAQDHETFGDPLSGEMQEHYNRVVNLVIGEPVVVIGDGGIPGLLAGSAIRGIIIGIDTSDPRFAFIDVTESGGPPKLHVNISRVFAASDPTLLIVP